MILRSPATGVLAARARRRGFSLAELMIALAVLGMGLLVIGAALPIGVRYTRESVNLATGEAAAEYAFQVLDQTLAVPKRLLDGTITGRVIARAPFFYPRLPQVSENVNDPNTHRTAWSRPDYYYEPIVKVRPVPTQQVQLGAPDREFPDPNDAAMRGENLIAGWLARAHPAVGGSLDTRDVISDPNWLAPAISSVCSVYPPVSADQPQLPRDFLNQPYRVHPVRSAVTNPPGNEVGKTRERRTSWVAFYRRASYQHDSDPLLFEFVTVAVRLPGPNYRFALPSLGAGTWFVGNSVGGAVSASMADGPLLSSVPQPGGGADNPLIQAEASQYDSTAPVPWLVTFYSVPLLQLQADYASAKVTTVQPAPNEVYERVLLTGFVPPPTLRFRADWRVGPLLPPGSIFIPAVNDYAPTRFQNPGSTVMIQGAGFVPSAPDALPIYEVVDRIPVKEGASTVYDIIVKNNGYYPWVAPALAGNGQQAARYWPVWVIPPAHERREAVGGTAAPQPVYSDQSPIVAVSRRFMRLNAE